MEVTWQAWTLAAVGAVTVGLGKGGLPGVGNLAIALFAAAFGAKASVGILLPVLSCADIVAIVLYRRSAQWRYIAKLFPMTALGVILGYFLFDALDADVFGRWMGAILLIMTGLHCLRQAVRARQPSSEADPVPHTWWFVCATGLSGGLATMLANAAGPIAAFYLMAVRLPKLHFVGTAAWFFFLINLFKLPFQAHLGTITLPSLGLSLSLGVVAALSCLAAPHLLKRIPQATFEKLVWAAVVLAALHLLLS